MKYYLAPLEGITNVYYRSLFCKYFNGVNKVYIPFLNPSTKTLTQKEEREIDPLNNKNNNVKVVPQIISKSKEDTIWLINILKEKGYDEINLNFGCPSGTVLSKGKGSGILKDLEKMDEYLNAIFSSVDVSISIKIRLGINDENEFENIIKILNKYPLNELIIHPRTAKEKYVGRLHLDYFEKIKDMTNFDIIYNGEVKTVEDLKYIENRFPFIKGIMLGRGLIAVPDMLMNEDDEFKKENLKMFYNELSLQNIKIFGWNNSKFYHKEIWACLISYFDVPTSLRKKLFKSEKEAEFKKYAEEIFSTCSINKNLKNGIKDLY